MTARLLARRDSDTLIAAPRLSVIVPTYCEAENVEPMIAALDEPLPASDGRSSSSTTIVPMEPRIWCGSEANATAACALSAALAGVVSPAP